MSCEGFQYIVTGERRVGGGTIAVAAKPLTPKA
jgi:hypothetical protein